MKTVIDRRKNKIKVRYDGTFVDSTSGPNRLVGLPDAIAACLRSEGMPTDGFLAGQDPDVPVRVTITLRMGKAKKK